MVQKSKEGLMLEYEKDYLNRLATKEKIKFKEKNKPEITEEERTQKVKEAEKIQMESAQQIQEASAARIQSKVDIKNKEEFMNNEILSLIDELKILKEELNNESTKRKVTKKKASPKRRITTKRKVTKKKASPKRRKSKRK